MKPHVLRARQGRSYWWVVANWQQVLIGRAGESLASILLRWEARYGKAKEGYNRVVGTMNLVGVGQQLGVLWRETAATEGGAR